jgi:hypothetical protein
MEECSLTFHIPEYRISIMELHPQDVAVALKALLPKGRRNWTYATLGEELCMSASQVFRSVERAQAANLLEPLVLGQVAGTPGVDSSSWFRPNRTNLKEFLVHGVRYAFPVHRGGPTRGIPTAEAAPPLNQHITPSPFPPVWPLAEGSVRGTEFSPLYKNAPRAALRDERLYELLALIDAIREGRARERDMAVRELTSRIDSL